jgi:hypothetical protein
MQEQQAPTRGFLGWLAERFASRAQKEEFVCGECDRWERCGLKPDTQCVARAAQMEANAGFPRRNRLPVTW